MADSLTINWLNRLQLTCSSQSDAAVFCFLFCFVYLFIFSPTPDAHVIKGTNWPKLSWAGSTAWAFRLPAQTCLCCFVTSRQRYYVPLFASTNKQMPPLPQSILFCEAMRFFFSPRYISFLSLPFTRCRTAKFSQHK